MKKHLIIPALVLTVAGTGGLLGARQAYAQAESDRPPLVEKLAERFKLNPDEVQAVFEEERDAHRAEMEAKFSMQLDQYVEQGKITAEQKQLILEKQKEMMEQHQQEFEQLKVKSPQERKALMQQHRTDIETWAAEHGIDPQYLMIKIKMKGKGPWMH